MPAAEISYFRTRFGFLQDIDDLLFGKSLVVQVEFSFLSSFLPPENSHFNRPSLRGEGQPGYRPA